MNLSRSLPIFVCFLALGAAQTITLFEHAGYTGFEHTSTITTSCETIPDRYWNKVSSVKTDKCILLYSYAECDGAFVRVEAGDTDVLTYFNDDTDSFRACDDITEESPFRDTRVKLYDNNRFDRLLIDIPVTDGCHNLPSWAYNKAASVKAGVCVNLYDYSDCQGKSFRVEAGEHETLPHFYDNTDSFSLCDTQDILKDYKLTVKINNMELVEDPEGTPGVADLDMGATQIFSNNGSATITQKYRVYSDVTETVKMDRVHTTSDFHRFYIDIDANFDYSFGIPVIAYGKLQASLRTGYEFQRNTTEQFSESYTSATTKGFELEQDLSIPPCRHYEVQSIVKLQRNYPIKYTAHAEVTGEYTGKRLLTSEIASRLPAEMRMVAEIDEYTVEVEFDNHLTADFGLTTETHGDGYPIEECLAIYK